MRVVLIRMRGAADVKDTWVQLCEPVGLGYLASALRSHGHDVWIVDAITRWLDVDEVVGEAAAFAPRLVGIAFTAEDWKIIGDSCEVALRLKHELPGAVVCAGGMFATLAHEWLLGRCAAIDAVLRGECEHTLPCFAAVLPDRSRWEAVPGVALRGSEGVKTVGSNPILAELDRLPAPAHDCLSDGLAHGGASMNLIASRGCYLRCEFCTIHAFNNRTTSNWWRPRDVRFVVDEMEAAYHSHGVRYFRFLDDEWVGPGRAGLEHAWGFVDELRSRGLTDARFNIICRPGSVRPDLFAALRGVGLHQVFIGAESGSDAFLKRYHKAQSAEINLRAVRTLCGLGLRVLLGFIMFDTGTTLEEIDENLRFLDHLGEADDAEVESFLGDIVPLVGAEVGRNTSGRTPDRNTDHEVICADGRAEAVRRAARSVLGRWQNLHSQERYRLLAELPRLAEDSTPPPIVKANHRIRRIFLDSLREIAGFARTGSDPGAWDQFTQGLRDAVDRRATPAMAYLCALRAAHHRRFSEKAHAALP